MLLLSPKQKHLLSLITVLVLSGVPITGTNSYVHAQTMEEAGILERTITYIKNCNYADKITNDKRFKNCLKGIIHTETVPGNATVISGTSEYSQIKSGGTYVIRGNLTDAPILQVPGNVTIYVDGSIQRNGNHSSGENGDDAIFMVDGKSDVNIIGVKNAKLTGNWKTTGVYVAGSNNVTVKGFEIHDVWEGLVARRDIPKDVLFMNNYIHDTERRAIWFLVAEDCYAVHNFTDNAHWDGIDFDAYVKRITAFENVAISVGRWCGFVEEAAQNCQFVCGVGIMADFWPGEHGYQMGWADNGTSQGIVNETGQLTKDNYFIGNTMFEPTSFTSTGSGNYFAKKGAGKGMTYFWGNEENGCTHGTGGDSWYNVEWKDEVTAEGQKIIDALNDQYNPATEVVPTVECAAKKQLLSVFNDRSGTVSFRLSIPRGYITANSSVTLAIFNLQGKLITILPAKKLQNNVFACQWDVNDASHTVSGRGCYVIHVRAGNTISFPGGSFLLR